MSRLIEGRVIAKTFWGKSWCRNLERYSDYANRLPRGRTYVRSGCVVDLQIALGTVDARVSGSRVYRVEVKVAPIPAPRCARRRARAFGKVEAYRFNGIASSRSALLAMTNEVSLRAKRSNLAPRVEAYRP